MLTAATPEKAAAKSSAKSSELVKVLPDSDPFAAAPAPDAAPTAGTSVSTPVVNLTSAGTVEIHVNDANLVEVLRMLSLQSQKNIVASKDVKGTVTANLYDVTVREALDALLAANGFAYREKGNFIYIYTAKEIADIEKAARVAQTRTFHLYYTPAQNAVNMIKPVLSSDAQVAFTAAPQGGLDTGTKDVGGASHAIEDVVVVTDYAENLDRVAKVLKEVDRRPQQILIEATILRATLTDDNALGVDFNVVGGVDFSSITSASGQIGNAGITNPTSPAGNTVSSVGTGNNFTNSVGNGFKVGVVTDNLSVFLSALESVTDTAVLANPKILALNKQKGEVIVGRKDGYTTSTTTDTSTTQTVEFLDTGTRLIFRPFIGDDGYVRMEIHPEDSSGGLTSANLPFKVTTEVTSNVMVKDGHTIMIGGLFRESSDSSRAQVPGLGNLPGIGALFRQQRDRTTREEIIILLTPHIIKDDVAYSQASEAELKEMERMRVGVRKGMMFFGRERLAETEYDKAVQEMNKPNPSLWKVRWHLDAATNLNPLFREAIVMKEQVTGKVVSSVTNSSVRTFVRDQIMAEQLMHPTTRPVMTEPSVEMKKPTTQPAKVAAATTQPTTQPAVVAETPATQSAAEVTAEVPATQPAAEVAVETPSTKPAEVVAETPATQPAAEVTAETPATRPAEVVAESPATKPSVTASVEAFIDAVADPVAPQPATKPAKGTVVTELPMDDAAGK